MNKIKMSNQDNKMINSNNDTLTINVKDALEIVPTFDGYNISVSEFAQACYEANSIISNNAEIIFTKLLRYKTTGEARQTLTGTNFRNLNEFIQHFKDLYDTGETLPQLFGRLGYEVQRENEGVIPFSNRLREIGCQILEYKRGQDNFNLENARAEVEEAINSCFRRGLKPDIEMKLPANLNTDEVLKKAVQIEKQIDSRRKLLMSVTNFDARRKNILLCDFCNQKDHTSSECSNKNKYCPYNRKPTYTEERCFVKFTQKKVCQICNNKGHLTKDCFRNSRCQSCKKLGHPTEKCRNNLVVPKVTRTYSDEKEIRCQLCDKKGHTALYCHKNKICQLCDNGKLL